jgi:transcriptional regulator with XRE-family HTH domain
MVPQSRRSNRLRVLAADVDPRARAPNNHGMDMKAIGRRVRQRRLELDLTQKALATNSEIALGTLQALEQAPRVKTPRQTSTKSLENIAKGLDWHIDHLMGTPTVREDPLLRGLRREDLVIARWYHDATTTMRRRVAALLRDEDDDVGAALALRLTHLPVDLQRKVEQLIASYEVLCPEAKMPTRHHQ